MQQERPQAVIASIPLSPDELDTGRFLDLARALEHLRTLATRTESLVAACRLQLGRVPWEVCVDRQREIVRLSVMIELAESASLESSLAIEQLNRDVIE